MKISDAKKLREGDIFDSTLDVVTHRYDVVAVERDRIIVNQRGWPVNSEMRWGDPNTRLFFARAVPVKIQQ